MTERKTKESLAQEIVDRIGDLVKDRADLGEIFEIVKREIWKRNDDQAADEWKAKLESSRTENNLLTWSEFSQKYGLHESERRVAYIHLPQKIIERGNSYFYDKPLTEKQRQQLADETTMSRQQAADYLGITLKQFDRLKKKHGLNHVTALKIESSHSSFPVSTYMYQKSEIDKLKKIL